MGNDLYWKKTPKPEKETYNSLSYSTWHFLQKLWDKKELEDLNGVELDHKNVDQLLTIRITALECGNEDLGNNITSLINAIEKYESITLYIKG
jgi:hypothetical protein